MRSLSCDTHAVDFAGDKQLTLIQHRLPTQSMPRIIRTVRVLLVLAIVFLPAIVQAQQVRWTLSHDNLPAGVDDLVLSAAETSITMKNGIPCTVSAPSLSGARQLSCTIGDTILEATVACDAMRPRDDKQLRFRAKSGGRQSYTHLSCTRRESGAS